MANGDVYAFAPTDNQIAAMTAVKSLVPDQNWFQVWNNMRIQYPDDFQDNDHDIYVLMNTWPTIPVPAAKAERSPPPTPPPSKTSPPPIHGYGVKKV